MKQNALFLLIDALRYDVLADAEAARLLVPNLARLMERGFVRRVVTNAQSTQFVMPSLFSLTYPLDYGGYNNGIRERPKSFVESLREAGYETHLMASCNQLGITLGFDRGFDTIRTTSDHRTSLESRITRTLSYDLALWKKGERNQQETVTLIQRELGLLLDSIEQSVHSFDKSIWPERLCRINARVASGCQAERELLKNEPLTVLHKLMIVPPGVYWRFLGKRRVNPLALFFFRALEGVRWRTRKYIAARTWCPFLLLSHYQALAGEIIDPICRFVANSNDRLWFVHMHVMDVHDCRSIGRPLHVLGRLRYWPRWFKARLTGKTNRRWLYDTALMYVDACVGKLFQTLEQTGQVERTVILVTGDHGSQYAESPRTKLPVGNRTHYEDIEVPLLLAGSAAQPDGSGLIDSMGVTATFLEALGIPLDKSYKGRSAFVPGRKAVITENCGHGNADLARRDIYFTVTTETHRLMATLCGDCLKVDALYDLVHDTRETRNLVDDPSSRHVIRELLDCLYAERGELLACRGLSHTTEA